VRERTEHEEAVECLTANFFWSPNFDEERTELEAAVECLTAGLLWSPTFREGKNGNDMAVECLTAKLIPPVEWTVMSVVYSSVGCIRQNCILS
jgi:hypothetical protein